MEWEVVMDIMQRATKLGVDENIQKILLRFDGENWCLVSSNEQHGWHVSCQGFQPRQVQWSAHVFFSGYREGPLNIIWLIYCCFNKLFVFNYGIANKSTYIIIKLEFPEWSCNSSRNLKLRLDSLCHCFMSSNKRCPKHIFGRFKKCSSSFN